MAFPISITSSVGASTCHSSTKRLSRARSWSSSRSLVAATWTSRPTVHSLNTVPRSSNATYSSESTSAPPAPLRPAPDLERPSTSCPGRRRRARVTRRKSCTPRFCYRVLALLARRKSRPIGKLRRGGDRALSAATFRRPRDADFAKRLVPVGEVTLTRDQASLHPEDLAKVRVELDAA